MLKVFIGVGHGGRDPGAVKYVKESAANLQMALGMKTELEKHGILVGISRMTEENDPLTEEIKEANAFNPDIAVEVHNNAGGGDGFEVYRQTNGYSEQSTRLAQCIEARVKASGQKSRGIKTRLNQYGTDYFGWCREVKAPAVLCEGFFVDNLKDVTDYDTVAEQREYGRVYALGVLDFFGLRSDSSDETDYRYTVQMGAFVYIDGASRFKMELSNLGYDAFIMGKNSMNVVCVGKFKTREEADQTKKALDSIGKKGYVISL